MNEIITRILSVVALAEELKNIVRHSWTSHGRHESVAEHTWRVSLMAMMIAKYVDKPVDELKLIKMVIVHDLVEAVCGDVPAFDIMNNHQARALKETKEKEAMAYILSISPEAIGQEISDLWQEFEAASTYEAKIATALDKLEAQIQHNEADFSTWTEIERSMTFRLGRYSTFDTFIDDLRLHVEQAGANKLIAAGLQISDYKALY